MFFQFKKEHGKIRQNTIIYVCTASRNSTAVEQRHLGKRQPVAIICPSSPPSLALSGLFPVLPFQEDDCTLLRSNCAHGPRLLCLHECDIESGLWLRLQRPETPSPSAAIYRPLGARFARGPSCLLQLGSHQRRDNKQVQRTGPAPATQQMWPPPQPPGEKTRLFLSFLRAARLPGHATGLEQRCSCLPDPSKDTGEKELQIMRTLRCIWGGLAKIRRKH
ncbi:hypothetical protein NN561_011547 [Cricetulus griseus]